MTTTDTTDDAARFSHDRFIIRQWVRAIINKYEVHAVANDAARPAEGELVAFVHQKGLKLKEQIPFYADVERSRLVFEIRARKVLEARGRYDVVDDAGRSIGELHKRFARSLLRSTWIVCDEHGRELVMLQEKNVALAVWRRFVGLIPVIGDLLGAIPIPYGFNVLAGAQLHERAGGAAPGTVIGSHTRRIGLRDVYDFDLRGDPARAFDRRLAVAAAIALDCLQRR